MQYRYSIIALALFATTPQAAGPKDPELQVQTYSDFVVFDSLDDTVDLQVNVSGPDGFRLTERRSGAEPAVVDLLDKSGNRLADGLYKYEVYAVPRVTIPREISSAMPDRNEVREQIGPGPSPLSGSFRVLDGEIMDGLEVEAGEEER